MEMCGAVDVFRAAVRALDTRRSPGIHECGAIFSFMKCGSLATAANPARS
jgi:hypothetical protein